MKYIILENACVSFRLFNNQSCVFILLYSFFIVQNGGTALHYASYFGHPHIVEYLVKSGANLDLQDKVITGHHLLAQTRLLIKSCMIM